MSEFRISFSIILSLLFYIGIYAVTAYSLYRIAKNCNVNCKFMAFIPVLQFYIIGAICEEYVIKGIYLRKMQWIMVGIFVLKFLLQFAIGFGASILSIALNLITALFFHKFFFLFTPQRAAIYTLFAILGDLPLTIILYLLKDKPMLMSAGAYPYPLADR